MTVDCGVSPWSEWSVCSKTCGGGQQTQTRTISKQAQNGGTACPTSLSQTQACNTQACPQDCVVSSWSAWSACTKACGGGVQTQTRTVDTPAANGGAACLVLQQQQPCNKQECPGMCPTCMLLSCFLFCFCSVFFFFNNSFFFSFFFFYYFFFMLFFYKLPN